MVEEMQVVKLGRNLHLTAPGSARTLCNRLISKQKQPNPRTGQLEWVERPRLELADAQPTCAQCRAVQRKPQERELDRKYGKVRTMQNAHQFDDPL